MEWALSITNSGSLEKLADPWKENSIADLSKLKNLIEEKLGEVTFARLYFGQEFCERMIPTVKELQKAVEEADSKKLEFTLVTPYVTETGLEKLKTLFEEFSKMHYESEIVVNDWGVLNLIRQSFPMLTPVIGRLLNKIGRDPRIKSYIKEVEAEDYDSFRRPNLAGEVMKEFLADQKAERIELDYSPQGLDRKLPEWGYRVSLYLPYSCITTGRICLMRSWSLDPSERFKASGKSCSRACQAYWLDMHDKSHKVKKNNDWKIAQKGNTVFMVFQNEFMVQRIAEAQRLGIDRIVFQPEPL